MNNDTEVSSRSNLELVILLHGLTGLLFVVWFLLVLSLMPRLFDAWQMTQVGMRPNVASPAVKASPEWFATWKAHMERDQFSQGQLTFNEMMSAHDR
jgi:hypothetical protein